MVAALQYKIRENKNSCVHAVPFRYATIRPNKYCEINGVVVECGGNVQTTSEYNTKVDIIVLVAGLYSERVGKPDDWDARTSGISDFLDCIKLKEALQISEDEYEDLMRQSSEEVVRAWPAIEAVARDLMEKGTVSQREVVARCEEHGIKKNIWVVG